MNLKNNKGYVGTDVLIAVLILLILVPTIMGIVFTINRSRNSADIKAGALNIAVNALEAAKNITLSQSDTDNEGEILTALASGIYNGQMEDADDPPTNPAVISTDKAIYQLQITVVDYSNNNEETEEVLPGVVKTVTADVRYKIGGEDPQTINLSTVVK